MACSRGIGGGLSPAVVGRRVLPETPTLRQGCHLDLVTLGTGSHLFLRGHDQHPGPARKETMATARYLLPAEWFGKTRILGLESPMPQARNMVQLVFLNGSPGQAAATGNHAAFVARRPARRSGTARSVEETHREGPGRCPTSLPPDRVRHRPAHGPTRRAAGWDRSQAEPATSGRVTR